MAAADPTNTIEIGVKTVADVGDLKLINTELQKTYDHIRKLQDLEAKKFGLRSSLFDLRSKYNRTQGHDDEARIMRKAIRVRENETRKELHHLEPELKAAKAKVKIDEDEADVVRKRKKKSADAVSKIEEHAAKTAAREKLKVDKRIATAGERIAKDEAIRSGQIAMAGARGGGGLGEHLLQGAIRKIPGGGMAVSAAKIRLQVKAHQAAAAAVKTALSQGATYKVANAFGQQAAANIMTSGAVTSIAAAGAQRAAGAIVGAAGGGMGAVGGLAVGGAALLTGGAILAGVGGYMAYKGARARLDAGRPGFEMAMAQRRSAQNLLAYTGQGNPRFTTPTGYGGRVRTDETRMVDLSRGVRTSANRLGALYGMNETEVMGGYQAALAAGGGKLGHNFGRQMRQLVEAKRGYNINFEEAGQIGRGGQLGVFGARLQGGGGYQAIGHVIGQAVAVGLEGSEINDHLSNIAGDIGEFRQTGMPVNAEGRMGAAALFRSGGFGSVQAAGMAGGIQQGLGRIGREGVSSGADFLALQAFGGLDISKDVGFKEYFNAKSKMAGGLNATNLRNYVKLLGRSTPEPEMQADLLMRTMSRQFSTQMEPGQALDFVQGKMDDPTINKLIADTNANAAAAEGDVGRRAGARSDEKIQQLEQVTKRMIDSGNLQAQAQINLLKSQQAYVEQINGFAGSVELMTKIINRFNEQFRNLLGGRPL